MTISARSGSRYQIKQGNLCLCYPLLPDLGCLLLEVDDQGCRGSVPFQYLPEDVRTSWRRILAPKRPLHIKIEIPPWLMSFEVDGLVMDISDSPSHTEIEMTFNHLTPAQSSALKDAVLAMATQKIRNAHAPVPPPPPSEHPAAPKAHGHPVPQAPAGQPFPEAVRAPESLYAPQPAGASLTDSSALLKLKKIGEVLVHMGRLTPMQVDEALVRARANGERLGRYLVRMGVVSPEVLCRALALQSGLPMTDLTGVEVPDKLARLFTHPIMARYAFVPFDEAKTFICIAAGTPLKSSIVRELEATINKKIEVFLAQEEQVLRLLDHLHLKQNRKARKHVRYDLSVPVRYQFTSRLGTPAEPNAHEGVTINASEGGFLIEGTPTALGSPEEMRRRGLCASVVLNSADGHAVHALCQLRAIREKERKAAEDPRWLLGMEIVEMSVEDRRRLKELCIKSAMNVPRNPSRQPFI